MSLLKAIIIDDEPDSVNVLLLQLGRYCSNVKIIATYTNTQKALEEIEKLNPDLLFLDVAMPGMNGFELLERISPFDFKVIFVTAYSQYAVRAFKCCAIDYLLKPADREELVTAINKVEETLKPSPIQLDMLRRQMGGETISRVAIPSPTGHSFIDINEIIYAAAKNNYTRLILQNGRVITIARTQEVQEILEARHFIRVHRQYIANLNHATHFNKNECILSMYNKTELPVARSQKDRLIERFEQL